MTIALEILLWVTTALFLLLGFVALGQWLKQRSRPSLLIFGALLSIGFIGLLGRAQELSGYRHRFLVDLSLIAIVASGYLLLEFRHSVLPMTARSRAVVATIVAALVVGGISAHFPAGKDPALSPGQRVFAFGIIILWLASLLEPAWRFWTTARHKPAIERARLRLLGAGYGGIVLILMIGVVFRSQRNTALALSLQAMALVLVPLFFVAVAPPKRLRAGWLQRETERERARLLLTLPAVVWSVDTEMRAISGAGAGMPSEVAEGDWLGLTLEEFHRRQGVTDLPASKRMIEMHRRALSGETVTYDIDYDDGVFECHLEPIYGPDGGVAGAIGLSFDVTERRDKERALRQALEREREAAKHLRALDDMKNSFLSAVSHELRTPLTSVLGFANTLQREDRLSPEDRELVIRRLVVSAEKLQDLLGDLLDLDRLRRGIVEPRRTSIDIGALVRRVGDAWIAETGRRLHVDTEPLIVSVDAPKVERIVENMLGNAAKYTPQGASVWVSVRAEGDGVLIAVEDDGPGVPGELRGEIFEPFRQGSSNGHSPGVGIGLSLVSNFAMLHGGRAWVEERPGGGARFLVWLAGTAVRQDRVSA